MSWIEVESKFKVSNPEYLRKELKKISKFVGMQKKVDKYYSTNIEHYPKKSIRLRKIGNIYQANLKKRISYEKGVHSKKEVEFEIKDPNLFIELIEDLGFKEWLKKEKNTELYKTHDGVSLELNFVKNLGWFLEIEVLTDKKGIKKAQQRVIELRNLLKISEPERTGYTKKLWNLKNKN